MNSFRALIAAVALAVVAVVAPAASEAAPPPVKVSTDLYMTWTWTG